jgi:hypothetical protein
MCGDCFTVSYKIVVAIFIGDLMSFTQFSDWGKFCGVQWSIEDFIKPNSQIKYSGRWSHGSNHTRYNAGIQCHLMYANF